MRKHIKILALLLLSLAMVIAVAGCTGSVSDIRQNSKPDNSALNPKKPVQKSTKPQYFFINGSLLGSHEDDGWHSLCDTDNSETEAGDSKPFYARDLLDQDAYYVYENNKPVGMSKQIIWLTGEAYGLGSFESEDVPGKFAAYGQLHHFEGDNDTAYRIFDLPVKLGPELSNLKIPEYSFHTDFVYGANWERRYLNDRFVTNSGANILPRNMAYGVEPTEEGRQLLIDLFKKNNMENTNPNFTECIRGDFDNDVEYEYLMIADSPSSELGYPLLCSNGRTDHLGIFNVMLYQDDDGNIQTLYSDLRPYKGFFEADKDNRMELMGGPEYCIEVDLFTVADLNSDGVYEIGIKKVEWEHGFYLTYARNTKGTYEVVMRSDFGT